MKRFFCAIIVLLFLISLVSCSKQIVWPSSELGRTIPTIENAKGEVKYDDSQSLYITLEKITKNQYDTYLNECKSKGFTIDVEQNSISYIAFNTDGYKLELNFYSNGDMWIRVEAPISMTDFQWPNTSISSLLPTPKSSFGKIKHSSDSSFIVYVGNTTINDYDNYVESVKTNGFTLNTNFGERYYYADNNEGYRLTLKYEGFNTMLVRIDAPSAEDNSNEIETDNSSGTTQNQNLTAQNNQDFAKLLTLKDPSDPSVELFATKYQDQTIEFDGCILSMQYHKNYKTRYDILLGCGNYDASKALGPNFHLTNVNAADMQLNTLYPEEIIYVGKNVHIVAKVINYNPNTTLFELDIISVTVR